MAKRYPKRRLSSKDISIALNFDSDSDDSNDKLEKFLGEEVATFEYKWLRGIHKVSFGWLILILVF